MDVELARADAGAGARRFTGPARAWPPAWEGRPPDEAREQARCTPKRRSTPRAPWRQRHRWPAYWAMASSLEREESRALSCEETSSMAALSCAILSARFCLVT